MVLSLRRSIEDRPPQGIGFISNDQWRDTLLSLEEVRLILRQAGRRIRHSQIDLELIDEAHRKLLHITSNASLLETVSSIKMLNMPVSKSERHMMERYRGQPAVEALYAAIDLSGTLANQSAQQALDFSDADVAVKLSRIVPEQKVSPAKFAIDGGRIVVIDQRHRPLSEDRDNVVSARDYLHASGARIVDALKSSNCDRRLIEGLERLQDALSHPGNVIELGLTSISCEAMCAMSADELPEAVRGQIQGHTSAVGMFVAQFPEWQRFSENAAAVTLSAQDIEEINFAASQIISQIDNKPEVADPAVPATIKAIRSLSTDPSGSLKKAAFALLRTIENFASTVFSYTSKLIGDTFIKASDKLSTAMSNTLVRVLMAAVIAGVAGMTGVTAKVSEAGWMKNAVEIVRRQAERAMSE